MAKINDSIRAKEGLQSAANQVADEVSRFVEDFENRLTLTNARFVERYLKGELQILIHITFSRDHSEHVARLKYAPSFVERRNEVRLRNY